MWAFYQFVDIRRGGWGKWSQAVCSGVGDRTRGYGHKLRDGKFPWNIRKQFFTVGVMEHWAEVALRGCGVPHL